MKARVMPETAAVIHVGGQRQQREILTIHVVLQIKYFRKTCSGNLRFVPRAIGFLGTEQETQPALATRSIEIAPRANSIRAHAVCDAVLSPLPFSVGSS